MKILEENNYTHKFYQFTKMHCEIKYWRQVTQKQRRLLLDHIIQ